MRERTKLETAISGYKRLETDLADTLELIEMGDAEATPKSSPRPRRRWLACWSRRGV
jgi:hypothetical protein